MPKGDPRFGEQPLSTRNDSGIAFVHDASLVSFTIRGLAQGFDETRRAHFADRHVFWSRRPLGRRVVGLFTLPPGDYELVAVGTSEIKGDQVIDVNAIHSTALPIKVEPHRVTVLGELRCGGPHVFVGSAQPHESGGIPPCEFDASRQESVNEVLDWEIRQPHNEEDLRLWRSWMPAISAATGRP